MLSRALRPLCGPQANLPASLLCSRQHNQQDCPVVSLQVSQLPLRQASLPNYLVVHRLVRFRPRDQAVSRLLCRQADLALSRPLSPVVSRAHSLRLFQVLDLRRGLRLDHSQARLLSLPACRVSSLQWNQRCSQLVSPVLDPVRSLVEFLPVDQQDSRVRARHASPPLLLLLSPARVPHNSL